MSFSINYTALKHYSNLLNPNDSLRKAEPQDVIPLPALCPGKTLAEAHKETGSAMPATLQRERLGKIQMSIIDGTVNK